MPQTALLAGRSEFPIWTSRSGIERGRVETLENKGIGGGATLCGRELDRYLINQRYQVTNITRLRELYVRCRGRGLMLVLVVIKRGYGNDGRLFDARFPPDVMALLRNHRYAASTCPGESPPAGTLGPWKVPSGCR